MMDGGWGWGCVQIGGGMVQPTPLSPGRFQQGPQGNGTQVSGILHLHLILEETILCGQLTSASPNPPILHGYVRQPQSMNDQSQVVIHSPTTCCVYFCLMTEPLASWM